MVGCVMFNLGLRYSPVNAAVAQAPSTRHWPILRYIELIERAQAHHALTMIHQRLAFTPELLELSQHQSGRLTLIWLQRLVPLPVLAWLGEYPSVLSEFNYAN